MLPLAFILVGCAVIISRWGNRQGAHKFAARHVAAGLLVLAALGLSIIFFMQTVEFVNNFKEYPSRGVAFLAPVQQPASPLNVEVSNVEDRFAPLVFLGFIWPGLLAALAWGYRWSSNKPSRQLVGTIAGWLLLTWSASVIAPTAPARRWS